MDTPRPQPELPDRTHSPITAAAILLAVFVAMYLTVGAIVHLFGAPADAHIATARPAVASDAPTPTAGAESAASPRERPDAHAD